MSGRSAKRRRREQALAAQQQRSRGGRGRVPASSVRRTTDRTARRRRQLLLTVGAAVVIAGVAIGVSLLRGSGSSKFTGLKGRAAVTARFSGIPQQGLALGHPKAPVTVEEFADFQCPICGEFAASTLPTLVKRYVRPGKVRIVFRGQDFLDQNFGTTDSEKLLRLALAAARQNRLWQVTDLIYVNQKKEGTHWASDPLLRAVAGAVPGLNATRALADRQSSWVDNQISQAATLFGQTPPNPADGQRGTPTFLVGRTGSPLQAVYHSGNDLASISAVIDPLLK